MKAVRKSPQFLIFCFAVSIIILAANKIEACSCATLDLKASIKFTPNIIVAKLKSVEKVEDGKESYDLERIKQSKFIVQKVYKGTLKVGQELDFIQGQCCICVMSFSEKDVGTEYLFYLGKPSDKHDLWRGNVCSRSGNRQYAAPDLMYLDKLPKIKGKTRLSGRLMWFDRTKKDSETKFLANVSIRIISKEKNIEIKTDENGVYDIYDLPVGKYRITPEKIKAFKLSFSDESEEVEVNKGELAEVDFFYEPIQISSKIFWSDINTSQNMRLSLFSDIPKAVSWDFSENTK